MIYYLRVRFTLDDGVADDDARQTAAAFRRCSRGSGDRLDEHSLDFLSAVRGCGGEPLSYEVNGRKVQMPPVQFNVHRYNYLRDHLFDAAEPDFDGIYFVVEYRTEGASCRILEEALAGRLLEAINGYAGRRIFVVGGTKQVARDEITLSIDVSPGPNANGADEGEEDDDDDEEDDEEEDERCNEGSGGCCHIL